MSKDPRRTFPVDEDEAGSRLETFLRQRLGLSGSVVFKALRKGWIRVDGRRAKAGQRIDQGQTVQVTNYALPLPALDRDQPPAAHVPRPSEALIHAAADSICHADDDVLVSNKPAGVVVHRGSGHDIGWVDALAFATGHGERVPTPVGRLDRDTSGLLVLARNRLAARRFFAGLRAGELARTYQALVFGVMHEDAGAIDLPLIKSGVPGRERMHVEQRGQPARTHFRVLERFARATSLELLLDTGRTHQIRVHLGERGHPLLGDPRYGTVASSRLTHALGLSRLFLHAAQVRFIHPRTHQHMTFAAPLPPELAISLERARTLR